MIAKHVLRGIHEIGWMVGISLLWTANVNGQSIHPPAPVNVSPVAIAKAGPGPHTLSASAFPNPDADETAHIVGLDSALQRLLALQSQRPTDVPPTLAELSARQELLELVQVSFLDVDSVLAELANEQSELGSIRTALQSRRDKTVNRLTTAALLTGSGLGAGVSATQFSSLGSKTQDVGDAIGIGSGAASTILSLLAARAQKGPSVRVEGTRNMLAPLLGGARVENTYYPATVLRYLQSSPTGEDPSRGTRLEQLMAEWEKAGRLSATNPAMRSQQIAALTASGDPKVKLTIDQLTDRIAMLGDVRGRVSLMKRDLATIMRSYSTPDREQK
ncbi:MAG TPA: hypothetical protein VGI45_19425 [Terracidiphilus sp.]